MILDARLNSVPLDRSAQVVIVGAGPVGLTLARELAGLAEILVVEAGGYDNDAEQQALLAGDCAGLPYPLTETRARQFGGSSALWAGYCAQFDEHDFSSRDWVPRSGWPFGVDEIQPYYARVGALLNLKEFNFNACDIGKRAGTTLPFDQNRFTPSVWRFGNPTVRFGDCFRAEFETSTQITTLIHANVVDIRLNPDGDSVTEVVIRTLNGRQGRVSLDVCILACGGLETPRILLNANTQVSHGVGNSTDMVGRCFMEHPHRAIASLVVYDRGLVESWTHRSTYDGNNEFIPCVGLSKQVQEEVGVSNARGHVYRTPAMRLDETPTVGLFMEQAPNPESRVVLSESRDCLDMRRLRLDWCLTELDWRTYEITASLISAEFERIGIGRLTGPIETGARGRETILHSNHQLGTTRMSDDRQNGVVDRHCRVYDLSNLYLIGGNVFPTVSWANPTFTVIALTLRLADHFRTKGMHGVRMRKESSNVEALR
jgi:choline dehydrogenase-like flavoprotein